MAPVPDYAEPLSGWRAWCLVEARGRMQLRSVVQETFWPRRRALRAQCLGAQHGDHRAPERSCGCGIHAALDPGSALHLLEGYGHYEAGQRRVASVLGRVFLWGTVVECETGWRAERAYPAHLYLLGPSAARRTREKLAALAAYDVPAELLDAGAAEDVVVAAARAWPARA